MRVLIYSDCFIYGGSERLMSFLLKNKLIQAEFNLYFAFRSHKLYRSGLKNEYIQSEKKNFIGLIILSNETLFHQINTLFIPDFIKKILKFPIWLVFKSGIPTLFNIIIQYFLVKILRPDIIHINNGGYPAARSCLSMVVAAWLAGCKSIVFQVNNQAMLPTNKLERLFDNWLASKVNYFITASDFAKQTLASNRTFDIDKIIQIPNTIRIQNITKTRVEVFLEYQIPETAFLICEVAFLEYRKGQHLLIEALDILRKSNPDIFEKTYLLFVGSGADANLLIDQAAANEVLGKHIIFTGYKSDSINYINACDLFALPSVANEDMPLVIFTAMSLGKTIVSTSFAGIKEQIENHVSGILLTPNTETLADELAQAIVECQLNIQHNFGIIAKKVFESKFSDTIYAERIISLYKSLQK